VRDDSEEKIIKDYNKLWEPSFWEVHMPELKKPPNKNISSDIEFIYRKLKIFASSHGKDERMLPKSKRSKKHEDRRRLRDTNKNFLELWARVKAWRKNKKLS